MEQVIDSALSDDDSQKSLNWKIEIWANDEPYDWGEMAVEHEISNCTPVHIEQLLDELLERLRQYSKKQR